MSIPSEIANLVERLNQEINLIEAEATAGVSLVRELLSRFPNNAILIQYFAYFNTIIFFIATAKRQIEATVEILSPSEVTNDVIQEAGEELGTLLGKVLEVKINVNRTKTRLENLP